MISIECWSEKHFQDQTEVFVFEFFYEKNRLHSISIMLQYFKADEIEIHY